MEYAVRGQVVLKADEIAKALQQAKKDSEKSPPRSYDHIVYTNIGNPHSVGQRPLSWPRQVLALVDLPPSLGVDNPYVTEMFPQDAIDRAREIQTALQGCGTGAYSHSQGVYALRQDVAHFIESRDGGIPCNPNNLFLTNGASAGIGMLLQTIVSGPNVGVLM
jgi:aspartate/methionine/tyrosine aminotransferase